MTDEEKALEPMQREFSVTMHNLAVHTMFNQIKPIIEGHDSPVVLNTLLIILAMCGQQADMPPEMFKSLVVKELDRLMLVDAENTTGRLA